MQSRDTFDIPSDPNIGLNFQDGASPRMISIYILHKKVEIMFPLGPCPHQSTHIKT